MAKLSALLLVLALAICRGDDEIISGDQPAQNATRSLEVKQLPELQHGYAQPRANAAPRPPPSWLLVGH